MSAPAGVGFNLHAESLMAARTAQSSGSVLQYLPFPAAIADRSGSLLAVNPVWRATYRTLAGESCLRWCEEAHLGATGVTAVLCSAIQTILGGGGSTFVQDCSACNPSHRITVSPCPEGALILQQGLPPALPEESGRAQSHRMETMGRLAAGVTHDFANLLTLISGYSEVLLGRLGQGDPIRAELEEIRKAALRGSRLTQQLLGFSRGAGATFKPLNLNTLIADVECMLRPILGEHIRLEVDLYSGLGTVIADAGQMEQVLINLILNARDAMPGGGRIRIETSHGALGESTSRLHGVKPGEYVLLSITDTGHGIHPADTGRIFDPFFTTKDHGHGTGLGLSTVRSIVRQSGGDIWVASSPGHGACFTVCLPCSHQTVEGETPADRMQAAPGHETVLLVEDEEGVRKLLSHVLVKRGYEVLEAADGEEAWRIFQERAGEIHLVLTDMVMPRMNGRELGDRILEFRPDTKVIYMSGYTDDVLLRTGALRPGISFLSKPLRPDVLAARLREALDSPSRPFNPR